MKNYYVVQDETTAIKAKSKYGIFWILIDTKDLGIMPKGTISISKHGKKFYAEYRENKKTERLHRLIMGFPERLDIDHWNHDTLDERRENLRAVTRHLNLLNMEAMGYGWREVTQRWRVYIKLNGKQIHLGCFKNETDAEYRYLLGKEIIHSV